MKATVVMTLSSDKHKPATLMELAHCLSFNSLTTLQTVDVTLGFEDDRPKLERLANGATVLLSYIVNDVDEYLLCTWEHGEVTQYVTWYRRADNKNSTAYGHYLDKFVDAVKDFAERIK